MLAPMMNDQNQIEQEGEYQQRGEARGEEEHLFGYGNVVYTFIAAGAVDTGDAHLSGNAATLHPTTEDVDVGTGKHMRRKASEKQASRSGFPKGERGERIMSTLGSISRSEGRDAAKGLAAAAKDFCGNAPTPAFCVKKTEREKAGGVASQKSLSLTMCNLLMQERSLHNRRLRVWHESRRVHPSLEQSE
jgi:hypothetical protein